jgi:hypothetical protein
VSEQLFLDQFAQPADGAGASGITIPVSMLAWMFPKGPYFPGKPLTDDVLEGPAFLFLESLALGNDRFPFQEYKRRAYEIAKVDLGILSRETRWLTDLSFVELESDTRGRWAYIHPLPLALYPLPFKADDRYQATLCGCAPRNRLRTLLELARQCGCGLPAHLEPACTAFSSARYGFLPNENADSYSGQCWVYPCVPMEIAKVLLSKLSAEPIPTPHASVSNLGIYTL